MNILVADAVLNVSKGSRGFCAVMSDDELAAFQEEVIGPYRDRVGVKASDSV